ATHSYLGLFRAQGQRVLVQWPADSAPDPLAWELLGVPSAFCMRPRECVWLYQHSRGLIEVRAGVRDEPHALTLSIAVLSGSPARFLITHHIALNGDDGALAGPAQWRAEAEGVRIVPA